MRRAHACKLAFVRATCARSHAPFKLFASLLARERASAGVRQCKLVWVEASDGREKMRERLRQRWAFERLWMRTERDQAGRGKDEEEN